MFNIYYSEKLMFIAHLLFWKKIVGNFIVSLPLKNKPIPQFEGFLKWHREPAK